MCAYIFQQDGVKVTIPTIKPMKEILLQTTLLGSKQAPYDHRQTMYNYRIYTF